MKYIFNFFNFFIFSFNHVKFRNTKVRGICVVSNKGTFKIGSNLRINSSPWANVIGGMTRSTFVVKKEGSLVIGNFVSISNSAFYCANNIIIEDFVMIGGSCKIWDTDFHPLDPEIRKISPNEYYNTRPIHIKESAFIGGFSIILKGVTIGKNSIVGAGSVVRESIPDNEIWAGNPARFIKKVSIK